MHCLQSVDLRGLLLAVHPILTRTGAHCFVVIIPHVVEAAAVRGLSCAEILMLDTASSSDASSSLSTFYLRAAIFLIAQVNKTSGHSARKVSAMLCVDTPVAECSVAWQRRAEAVRCGLYVRVVSAARH